MEEMFSDRIKATMKARGLNQKELAERTHLTEATVSKYLSGYQKPHLDVLVVLAKSLNVTTDYLLGVENKSQEENFQLVYEMIRRNKGAMSAEEKMKLIALLTT
jgi:transcriptional regulator with XRE-family HTH domain